MEILDGTVVLLIRLLFDLYLFVVLLRLVLQWARVDFYNPIAQFTVKSTDPLRRFLPTVRGIDLAIVVVLFALVIFELILISWIGSGNFPNLLGIFIWAIGDILSKLINLFFYAILIVVILSWVNPTGAGPLYDILYRITEPVLRPVRNILPSLGGFDLSPIFVLIGLKLISLILVRTLISIGFSMAVGT